MRCRYEQLGRWAGAVGMGLMLSHGARAQVEVEDPAQSESTEDGADRMSEIDRLTGVCLAFQQEQRELRDTIRDRVGAENRRLETLEQASAELEGPADSAAATVWRERATQLRAQAQQVLRWLRGEEQPETSGLTRAVLREQLDTLMTQERDASLLAQACAIEDADERNQLRRRVLQETRAVRQRMQATTKPLRDRLAELDAFAAEQGERFEQLMTGMGQVSDRCAVAVMAVRADGWFEHGLVSFRWTDRRGQLVASARVRLLPHADTDTSPPLLAERFPILNQSAQAAELHVAYFSVDFHVAVPELAGEQQVLDTLVRLLDLDALSAVRPGGVAPGQN